MICNSNLSRKPEQGQDPPPIDYDEAVHEGQQLLQRIENTQLRLGEIAHRVEPRYGDQTLARFAEAIGIDPESLKRYRSVYRAWADIRAPGPILTYAVARELAGHPDREAIVAAQPAITKRQAQQKMLEYRSLDGVARQRRLLKLAREVIRETEDSDWDAGSLQPGVADTVRRAADALTRTADILEGKPAELEEAA